MLDDACALEPEHIHHGETSGWVQSEFEMNRAKALASEGCLVSRQYLGIGKASSEDGDGSIATLCRVRVVLDILPMYTGN